MIPSHAATRRLATAAASLLLVACSLSPAHAQPLAAPDPTDPRMLFDDARVPPDVDPVLEPEALISGDERIDALATTYRWSTSAVTYSFYEDSVWGGKYYGSETGVREVSEGVKQNVRAIMAAYTAIMNVTFVEVAETAAEIGQIRFMLSPAATYAYAYYPSSSSIFHVSGDVHLNPAYDRTGDTNGFQNPAGEHGYSALVHEIGHALGLKHPHTGTPVLTASIDNNTNTVMSYVFQGRSPATAMAFDVLALQYLYGARATRGGEDTYVFRRADADQFSVGSQYFQSPSNGGKQVLWDAGGYNTLDFSGISSNSGYRIDTRPLGWITTGANYLTSYYGAGVTLGPGVRIQKVVTSPSDDTIYANSDANTFSGYTAGRAVGRDVIVDASTVDIIDLADYGVDQVTQTASGSDLVLGLGGNGSITIRNYYGGNRPTIRFGTASAPTPDVLITISDTRVSEGDTENWTHWFLVRLSEPANTTITVSWTTVDGTATAPADYVAGSGIVSFAPGETLKYIAVTEVGDTVAEADEFFTVVLSNPSPGASIADGEGTGLIVNDDINAGKVLTASAAASPSSGVAPLTVTFSSAASVLADGTTATYAWDFGDGTSATGPGPAHVYTTTGSFTATLTITDSAGARATSAVLITVAAAPANKAPIATVTGAPLSGVAPLPVAFTSAGSTDADGTIVSYAWSFGDGGTASGPSPTYTYVNPGTYAVTLTVTDDKGATATATVSVVVSAPKVNTPPTAVLTASATTGIAPLVVAFSSVGSADADGSIARTAWAFGTGATSADAAPTYSFTSPGTYTVTLTVTDDQGASDTRTTTIVVTAPPTSTGTTMAVGAMAMDVQAQQTGQVVRTFVTVVDEKGTPLPNVMVTGRWYGLLVTTNVFALTDASGRATFASKVFFQNGAVGFTVVSLVRDGLTYDATRNVETKIQINADKATP